MFNKFLAAGTLFAFCFSSYSSSVLCSPSEERIEYTDLTSSSPYGNNDISLEPANIFKIEAASDITSLPETGAPQIVELTINENIDVVDSNNDKIDSLETIYSTYLLGEIIPAVRIETSQIADSYIDYVENTCYIQDSFIITDDLISLREFAENSSTDDMNLVFDVTQYNLNDKETLDNLLFEGNKAQSTIFVLDGNEENLSDHINYFQKRLKTTWVQTDSSYTNIARAIASGCYGVMSNDYQTTVELLSNFTLEGRNRQQYIAAHRGITNGYNENSLSAVNQAAEINADFVEIDLQITKDNQIVVCHNSQPAYTSNFENETKRFINMNYEDISEYTLNDQDIEVGEHFPLLSDMFEATKDTDLIYVLEFKFDDGSDTAIFTDVAKYVAPIVEEYNYQDRVLGITFFRGFFSSIEEHMPYMPTAYLGLQGDSQYKSIREVKDLIHFFKKYNTSMDYPYNLDMADKSFDYGIRGYSSNGYTFEDKKHLYRPLQICTTNIAENLSDNVKGFADSNWISVDSSSQITDNMNLDWVTYDGTVVSKSSKLIILEGDKDVDPYLTCVANYYDETDEYGLYSPIFTISNIGLGGSQVSDIEYSSPEKTLKIDDSGNIVDETSSAETSTSSATSSESEEEENDNLDNTVRNTVIISLVSACLVGLGIVSWFIVKKSKK